ncbi:MAG: Flp pilus assembly protein CpaB [Rhodobacteraceae bacterium]|nr:Flp pilus assembly protein CpaB [Paracoccaceae bacterium]
MNIRSILVTVVGLCIAGVSAYYARDLMSDRVAQETQAIRVEAEQAMATVVVALEDIPFAAPITRKMVAVQDWPRDALPEGAFQTLDAVIGAGDEAPRSAKRAIAAGELLLASKLSGFGEKVTILQTLTAGTRAMTIEVNAVSGVAGFVKPGDFVDIVLTENRSGDLRARTIMQNVRVIGVDQEYGEGVETNRVARTLTVEVTPEDGQRLALAQRAGSLSLTLRTTDGGSDAPLPAMSLSDLLDMAEEPEIEQVEETAAEPKRTVTIRRGNSAEVVEIED